ncbi:MAG: hypothetical protein AAGB31_11090 [Bdellovibrio sp.]
MKKSIITFLTASALALSAQAATTSSLFVKEGRSLINVEDLIQDEVDVQVEYGYEKFCYTGNVSFVVKKMKSWIKTDFFFSGGGGGFTIQGFKVIHGIMTYDIALTLEDEVVPGEFRTVFIKPCP